ncbi:hypothetical protein EMIHUDRAFT_98771 [Emiliania huxleyi CCMP1516]|uniref:Uncharacterized protein n=2 Tax=Emiliania huxleyi TaxID=2903 RepID=A0A0D3KF59_EMIH1|nr:hypothetical protein EMIHUDRAFT_98771 [Emiliania huxleyi CCMP1516]EOD34394.1 hypothetical protein EMIHUDRAFT_98771 [Emiliania huxleyi CCMP1516]|eukprot:XP_005786823.1 hypothetical protein EMIHUDRAFT_98771 [Emiliania huxleyi CCMP1516]
MPQSPLRGDPPSPRVSVSFASHRWGAGGGVLVTALCMIARLADGSYDAADAAALADAGAASAEAAGGGAGGGAIAYFVSLVSNAFLAHYNAPSVLTALAPQPAGEAARVGAPEEEAPSWLAVRLRRAAEINEEFAEYARRLSPPLLRRLRIGGDKGGGKGGGGKGGGGKGGRGRYLTFGAASDANILNSYASADPLAVVARLGVGAAVLPAVVCSSVAALCGVAALGIDLDTISALGGATGGSLLIYVAPALMALRSFPRGETDGIPKIGQTPAGAALPEEAFLSLPELIEATRPFQGLPVAALSYPWLTKDHPDPNGDNLRRVAQALKALLSGPNAFRRLGVFWDFLSLHQHPDPANGVVRTEEQNTLFKQGLGCLGTLYSHPQTTVLRLTSLPAGHKEDQLMGANVAKYFDRGWCFTEASWASLTKNGKKSLDLSKMRDDKEYVCGSLVTECTKGGGRRPPLLPSRFAAELETKSFTNGKDDKPLVQRLYEAAFEEQFGKAEELDYGHLGWGDAEAAQLAEVLLMGSNSPELDAVCRDRGITLTAVAGVVAPSEASLLERG